MEDLIKYPEEYIPYTGMVVMNFDGLNESKFKNELRKLKTDPKDIPEVDGVVNLIADLVGNCPIEVYRNKIENGKKVGNERVRGGFGKFFYRPNKFIGRSTYLRNIVRNLLLYGNAVHFISTKKSFNFMTNEDQDVFDSLDPIPNSKIEFDYRRQEDKFEAPYTIIIDGKRQDPDQYLHFTFGVRDEFPYVGQSRVESLADTMKNLKSLSIAQTEFLKQGFSMPYLIAVPAMLSKEKNADGESMLDVTRDKIDEQIRSGKPIAIPSDSVSIESLPVRTIKDYSVRETKEVQRETIARAFNLPPHRYSNFQFDKEAEDNFITSMVMPICEAIGQEMTNKLCISDTYFIKVNHENLYGTNVNYINTLTTALEKGTITPNEFNTKALKLEPSEEEYMDKRRILENYIPVEDIDKQKKLIQDE